jgi:hypothetical protein
VRDGPDITPEGADPAAKGAPEDDGRYLPVLAAPEGRPVEPEPRALARPRAGLPAPAVAAVGGFLAGVAAYVLLRVMRAARGPARLLPGRRRRLARRRDGGLEIASSRSFLVDVHLLRR